MTEIRNYEYSKFRTRRELNNSIWHVNLWPTEWIPFLFSKYNHVFFDLFDLFFSVEFIHFFYLFFLEFPNNFRLIKAHKSVWKFAHRVHNWIMSINANKFIVFNYYSWSCCCYYCCLFLFTLCLIYVNCAAITCEMHTKCS